MKSSNIAAGIVALVIAIGVLAATSIDAPEPDAPQVRLTDSQAYDKLWYQYVELAENSVPCSPPLKGELLLYEVTKEGPLCSYVTNRGYGSAPKLRAEIHPHKGAM